jgi:hypothetical protein
VDITTGFGSKTAKIEIVPKGRCLIKILGGNIYIVVE